MIKDSVELRPMTPTEFASFRRRSQRWYAAAKVRAGNWLPGEAQRRTAALWAKLLPQGQATPDQFFRTIEKEGRQAGYLWFGIIPDGDRRVAYLMDLYVMFPRRRQGVARHALDKMEAELGRFGVDCLRLEVFGQNRGARALYARLGFVETNVEMAKPLRVPRVAG